MKAFRCLILAGSVGLVASAAEPYESDQADLIALAARSREALRMPIATVVDKPGPSPTGDAHDYVSYARYYWPDPSRPGGLPFLREDGHHNRAQVAQGDHERLWNMSTAVAALAAAWHVNHDEAAARRAGEWLRAWFVNPATFMKPRLDYAQVRLGHDRNQGSASGVLDARCLAQVIDALRLLHESPAFQPGDEAALRSWFTAYLGWLTTARNALREKDAANNHGSWFLAQIIPIARYAGRDDLARKLCEGDRARLDAQIRSDGRQPEEIRRADGLSYSTFNLEAQLHIARLARGLGIDLWNYPSAGHSKLRQGLDFLRPFNGNPAAWPTSQTARLQPGFLDDVIKMADRFANPAPAAKPATP